MMRRSNQSEKEPINDIVVFDTYAWVEYVLSGPYAEEVERRLATAAEALTPASVIGELKEVMLRHDVDAEKIDLIMKYVKGKTTVVNIDAEIAEKAGEINYEYKKTIKGWGMLDSLVYAATVARKAKVVTGDTHFKDLPNVIPIL